MSEVFEGPWRITFDTNPDDCNLNCIMCEENSFFSRKRMRRNLTQAKKRRMDVRIIRRVVEECHGNGLREIIPSTMGEPLLYRHFDEIVDLCHEHDLLLNLTTNGTFPRRSATEWAERICPVASDVKISWNGAKPETQESIMVGSDFHQHLQNVHDFISVRNQLAESGHFCTITLQITFMEKNFEEIPDIIGLAAKLGVDRVKGHHLWVNFPEMAAQSLRRSGESIKRWNRMVLRLRQASELPKLPNGRRVLLDNFYPLVPQPDGVPDGSVCPFLGKEAWINHSGRFDPCCAPDDLRKTLGYFGNVTETPFKDLWKSREYRSLCENYLEMDVCQTCSMRRPSGRCEVGL